MPQYLRYIFKLSLSQKSLFSGLLALIVVTSLTRLVEPYLYKVIVDSLTTGITSGFTSDHTHLLITAVVVWFCIAIVVNLSHAQSLYLSWRLGNRNSQMAHMEGYRRLLRMDYAEHTRKHSSKYVEAIDKADNSIWEMTNWWIHKFSSAMLGFIGMLVIALTVSWQMTLVALSVLPVGIWFIVHTVVKYEDEQRRVNKLWDRKHEHLADQISNIVTYKLNPFERLFLSRQQQYVTKAEHAQNELNKKWRIAEMVNLDVVARFLVMGMGILFVKQGSITLGTLFMFMGLLNEILTPLHLMGDVLPQYTRRAQQINRFVNLLEKPDQLTDPVKPTRFDEIEGRVEVTHVSFHYTTESKVSFSLHDVTFEILPGQTVALVGHSGSGKTTIMTLLNRLVDPAEGEILIDGVDLRSFNREKLKRNIGSVLQETALYNESVAENISYGEPQATREDIVRAAKQAHAHQFIQRLPEKYDTLVGERGVRLSGGEKQRLAIARAILKNPKIVILDEPTSALDSITESQVQRGISALMKGRSTLIIAHRLSTVREADNIIILERGRIVAQGTHQMLMKTSELYQRMVKLQIGGFLADE